jgi:hypothetical protein
VGQGPRRRDPREEFASPDLGSGEASADDPDHPGWPAGTPGGLGGKFRPKDDGQESPDDRIRLAAEDDPNKASDATSEEWVRYQKYGKSHHWVGWDVYKHFPKLPEETRKVFENATSGPLADQTVNWFNREHRAYDKAVVQAFKDFLKEKNTTEDRVTPEQADEFWRKMRWNSDPVIGSYNRKIIGQRLRYIRFFWFQGVGEED